MSQTIKENLMRFIFLVTALVSVLAVLLICYFLFINGIPALAKIGLDNFIFGKEWDPTNNIYGIFPMIIASIYVTAGAIIVGVPIGLFTAVYMAKYCSNKIHRFLKPAVDLLAGIPSIIYGFFGLSALVPIIRNIFGGSGKGILTASIILGIMILPTIISVSENAIRAIPETLYEGALGLGSTKEQAIFKVIIPAASSGIFAGIVLGIGRAIGETMAVVLIAGNSVSMPTSPLSMVRTMTANIVLEMGYATGLHREALIATGVVLFVFILIINISLNLIRRKAL